MSHYLVAQNETLKEKTDILSQEKADLDTEIIKLWTIIKEKDIQFINQSNEMKK